MRLCYPINIVIVWQYACAHSIIDLADHEEQILPTLERALCDIGFVLVTGHDVPAELVRNLRQHLIDYFRPPARREDGGAHQAG